MNTEEGGVESQQFLIYIFNLSTYFESHFDHWIYEWEHYIFR